MYEQWTEDAFEQALVEFFAQVADGEAEFGTDVVETEMPVSSASTFSESGVMTNNGGLVVRMSDGSEFQVTIVKSR